MPKLWRAIIILVVLTGASILVDVVGSPAEDFASRTYIMVTILGAAIGLELAEMFA